MKRKFNWWALVNVIAMLISGGYLIYTFVVLAIVPFITDNLTCLTMWGFILTVISTLTLFVTIEYVEEYLQVRIRRIKDKYKNEKLVISELEKIQKLINDANSYYKVGGMKNVQKNKKEDN